MEVRLHEGAQRVLDAIKLGIASERMEGTPENVVGAAISTFLEMHRRNDRSRAEELLQVILAYKSHIADGMSSTELVRTLLLSVGDEKMHQQGFRIIKHFVRSGRYCMGHFRMLLEECFGRKGLKTRSVELIRMYLGRDEFKREFVKHVSGLRGVDLIRHINCFFDAVAAEVDVVSKLDSVVRADLFGDGECVEQRALYSECCDLLYNYTAMEMSAETPSERTFEYIMEKLVTLFEIRLPRGGKLLQTLSLLAEKDLALSLRGSGRVMVLGAGLKREVARELCGQRLKNEQIYEFVRSVRHMLVPEFMGLIRDMAERFVGGDDRYRFALGAIAGMMGIEDLFGVLDGVSKDVRTWAPIIRSSSNGDISFFIRLYREVEETKGPGSMDKTILLNCLPAFCNYGCDGTGSIGVLLQIMKTNMGDPNVFSSICTGLWRLVHSHESNMSSSLVLRNPIPASESARILGSVSESGIALDVLAGSLRGSSDELDRTLHKLLEKDDFGLSQGIFQYILRHPHGEAVAIGSWNVAGIADVLRVARFFVPRMESDFEVYSKVMDLALSGDEGVQKRAYQLLYDMVQHSKIDLCICDALFAHDAAERAKECSQRWRVSLIYLVYVSGCKCFPDRRKEYLNRMLPVLVVGLKTGNARTRRICLESLEELVAGFDDSEFDFYTRLMSAGMASESVVLRCGVLEAVVSLMESQRERLPQEFVQSIYDGCTSTSRLGRAAAPHVLRFLSALVDASWACLEDCIEILGLYVDSLKGRCRDEIKEVISKLVDRGVEVPKRLRPFLKERRRRGPRTTLQITKKNDVVITQDKRKQAVPFVSHRRTIRPNKKHKK